MTPFSHRKCMAGRLPAISVTAGVPAGLLLLNSRRLQTRSINYLRRLLNRSQSSIKTAGGLTLPNEAWEMIFASTMEMEKDGSASGWRTVRIDGVEFINADKFVLYCSTDLFCLDLDTFPSIGGAGLQLLEDWMHGKKGNDSKPPPGLKRDTSGRQKDGNFTVDVDSHNEGPCTRGYVLFAKVPANDILDHINMAVCPLCGDFPHGPYRIPYEWEGWTDWVHYGAAHFGDLHDQHPNFDPKRFFNACMRATKDGNDEEEYYELDGYGNEEEDASTGDHEAAGDEDEGNGDENENGGEDDNDDGEGYEDEDEDEDEDALSSACPLCMGLELATEHRMFKVRTLGFSDERLGDFGRCWRKDLSHRLSNQTGWYFAA